MTQAIHLPTLARSLYESGARHQWRRLRDAVRDGEHLDDLPGLADDLDLLRRL